MTAMFPASGVPAIDAKNTLTDPDTANCEELWYSTSRCQPRFDPAAANAQLSELINLINKGEVTYDCEKLDQVQLAVRYLVQRGKMSGCRLSGGPSQYTGALDPKCTGYNDYMTIRVVPNQACIDNPSLSLDGIGFVPIMRNDGQQLKAGDMMVDAPMILVAYLGKWFVPYLVRSQVPQQLTFNADLYVNSATGSDTIYNGLTPNVTTGANGPFRTIQRAINETFRYGPSVYTMSIHIAVGTYPEGVITPGFAGPTINLMGESNTGTIVTGQADRATIAVAGPNTVNVLNLFASNLNPNTLGGQQVIFYSVSGGYMSVNNCKSGSSINYIFCAYSKGQMAILNHRFSAGTTCTHAIVCAISSSIAFGILGNVWTWTFEGSMACSVCFVSASGTASVETGSSANLIMTGAAGVTGQRYVCSLNGVVISGGGGANFFPGSIAGAVSTGGQYQ